MKKLIVEKKKILNNLKIVKKQTDARIIAVLKGNAYGLSLLPMARLLYENDVNFFAVTEPHDAVKIRNAGMNDAKILILRSTAVPEELEEIISAKALATIGTYEAAVALNAMAAKMGICVDVHVKIDTGMGRYGFFGSDISQVSGMYTNFEHLSVKGIYTHFHSAFSSEKSVRKQMELFTQVIERLKSEGINPGIIHAANSSAALLYKEASFDAVRIGSAFTGRLPVKKDVGLQKACTFSSEVSEIRWLPKGSTVGYGAGYVAKKPVKIAVVPVGYIDGFGVEKAHDLFRFRDCVRYVLSDILAFFKRKHFSVILSGKRAKVLGHIGMCHTTVDITDLECSVGDEVIFDISPLYINPNIERIYE